MIITAGVVALCEWLMAWAPKHSAAARSLLDPRAVFIGVWMQQGVLVRGDEGTDAMRGNSFGVFSIQYDSAAQTYRVDGSAYDPRAKEHARWQFRRHHAFRQGRPLHDLDLAGGAGAGRLRSRSAS